MTPIEEGGKKVSSVCAFHKDAEKQLKDHEERLRYLEKSNTQILVRLDNLCKQLAELATTIKRAVYGAMGVGIAFIIWYLQSLPR